MAYNYLQRASATAPPFKRNGPSAEEIEIIGIEFTLRKPDGRIEEMQMFATSIIIPRCRPYGDYQPRITFHTNDGDYTMEAGIMGNRPAW